MEHHKDCDKCHTTMGLDDGCEWPDAGPYYCWSCAHEIIAEQSQLVKDLAMLVRRLVTEKQVVKKAKDFLVRKGLQGSPLRDT